ISSGGGEWRDLAKHYGSQHKHEYCCRSSGAIHCRSPGITHCRVNFKKTVGNIHTNQSCLDFDLKKKGAKANSNGSRQIRTVRTPGQTREMSGPVRSERWVN